MANNLALLTGKRWSAASLNIARAFAAEPAAAAATDMGYVTQVQQPGQRNRAIDQAAGVGKTAEGLSALSCR